MNETQIALKSYNKPQQGPSCSAQVGTKRIKIIEEAYDSVAMSCICTVEARVRGSV